MNTLMLVALAVVLFCYCGGKYCPAVLKQNKELILGVLVGMALCSFTGLRLEGFNPDPNSQLSASEYIECVQQARNKSTAAPEGERGEAFQNAVQLCTTQALNYINARDTPSPP